MVRSLALGSVARDEARADTEGLRSLPPGRYFVEQVEEAPVLTPEEEGIREAMRSLEAGEGRSVARVRTALSAVIKR